MSNASSVLYSRARRYSCDIQRCYRARLGIEVAAGCLPKPFLLLDADGLWMVGRDSMSLELEALSFRVMVESDLNVDGMLIEPARKEG